MKNAAALAILCTALWVIRYGIVLLNSLAGVSGGFVALSVLLASLVDFFAVMSLLIFFVMYYRSQS